jgi:SAM-dependent methyltransferase
MNFHECTKERWQQAQQWEKEIWRDYPEDSDDWNQWWAAKFCGYNFLKGNEICSMLEVGCGPWAKNTRIIFGVIGAKKLFLEDPLLDDYVSMNKSVARLAAERFSVPLEELKLPERVDLVICINVLDHVYSMSRCMDVMSGSLRKNGVIIVGQDLTNDEDVCKMPVADVGHPIRLDESRCMSFLNSYEPVFSKVLPRQEGRNPDAHYATLLFSGRKGTT